MLCSKPTKVQIPSLPFHRHSCTMTLPFPVDIYLRLLHHCNPRLETLLKNLPDIVTIVFGPIVVNDAIKFIVPHHAFLLACKLYSLFYVYSIVTLFEVHHSLAKNKPFEVDYKDFRQ